MGNGHIPEHTLEYTAQHIIFHCRHISKVTANLYAQLCNIPNGLSEYYGVMTRSSTSWPAILHAYTPWKSSSSVQQIIAQISAETATSPGLGHHHSSKASSNEPSSFLSSKDPHDSEMES